MEWPADKAERWALDRLVPYARNARNHTETQVAQLVAAIREYGWTIPVLVDEKGEIIAGHGRVLAAHELGLAEVPVIVARRWSAKKKRAYRLADNKLALNADWNYDLLRGELGDLRDLGVDLDLTGFGGMEVEQLFGPDNDPLAEWRGMPEFNQNAKLAFKSIVVHLKDPDAVRQFATLLGQTITEKTRFLWFPPADIERYVDKRYEAEPAE
jgi:hypothetical protein